MTKNLIRPAKTKRASAVHLGWSVNLSRLLGSLSFSAVLLVLSCCLALLPQTSHAYNIDLPSYVRHRRPPNTMFGYSLAFFKGVDGYPQSHSLLVGAPKLNASRTLIENGGVFRCAMNDDDCSFVQFDAIDDDNKNTQGDTISRKSYQWFGATVTTSPDSDVIVACAPRFIFHTMKPRREMRYDPVGTCFVSRNFTNFHEVSPCRTHAFGYHRQGSCQAGFSAAVSRNGERFFVGAPGSWYWQGQVYSIWPDATFPYKPPSYSPFGTGGRSFTYDITRPENQVFSTTEGSKFDDDSYLGYSMITGDFNGDKVDDVAIGMPRASRLVGKIVVNRWNMVNMFNITGRQIGEYFGYALATSDVDGDGLDDLIIGAPMFSETGNTEGHYDVGRVYILLQKATSGPERWITEHIRDGYNSKSRFGTALASLGDINRDGYGDFAVGAPYDGIEGRGIVYIFHGSPNGPLQKPSQIIKAEDIVESVAYPRTFGFSLAGGVDMDGNTYPDLAVGAYASGQVFIFKSRPVAAVNAATSFANPNKLIDLDVKRCQTVRDNKKVACTDIATCWSYTGEYLPGNLEFDVSWVLDAKKPKNPRMFFLLDEGRNIRNQSISLSYGKTYCRNETVYVVDNIQDKLTPLEVETHYNLRSAYGYSSQRRKRETLEPVIDQNREIVPKDVINIQKNCGEDNICVPDLRLVIESVDKYVLGSREPLVIDVLITNMNEDAFEAAFYMTLPKDLDFKKIQQSGDKADTPITCTAPSEDNNHTLKCDIGNPLQAKNVAKFKVIMLPSHKVGMAPSYDFFMEANSTNLEREGSHFDNIIKKSIGIWVETDLSIEGVSLPDSQNYNASNYKSVADSQKEDDLGPHVVHLYNIRNNGPSVIEEAVVLIHYPFETVAGDVLMYLTNQPETSGNIECEYHFNANVRNLQLDQTLVKKSYLEQVGAVVRNSNAGNSNRVQENMAGGGSSVVSLVDKPKPLSEAELRQLQAEEDQHATGDASFVHSQRANSGANSQGGAAAWSSAWNSSSPSVVISSRNSSVYYDASGAPHIVESSTQYSANYDRLPAHYTSQQQQQQQQQVGNYQQASANSYGASQPQQQQQQRQQRLQQQNVQMAKPTESLGAHSARGHIEMAPESEQVHQQNYVTNYGIRNNPQNGYRVQSSTSQEQKRPINYGSFGGVSSNNYAGQMNKPGGGFQVGTLDLGQMQGGNLDHELRQQNSGGVGVGGGGARSSNSYGFQQSFSPQEATVPRYHQSVSTFGGSRPYYGVESPEDYMEDNNHVPQRQQQQQRRIRRQEPSADTTLEPQLAPQPLQVDVACKAAKCETLRCVARNLGKDDDVWVGIRARMVAHTMAKLASDMPLNVSTMAISYVTRLPYIGQPKDEIKRSHEIFYKAVPELAPVPDVVPLWVVVLAACAGALILLLLIFLLYKCGFFKRNRPTDHSMERQPLRNGYHGDEHL